MKFGVLDSVNSIERVQVPQVLGTHLASSEPMWNAIKL